MRKAFFSWLAIVLFLPLPVLAGKTLVMSVGGAWPPYHYEGQQGLTGIDVVLAQEILTRAKQQLQIKKIPALRGQEYLKRGEIDLLPGASFNEERSRYAWFSSPYRLEQVAVFVRKGMAANWPINRLIEIVHYPALRLAAGRGGWYGPQYQEVLDDPQAREKIDLTGSSESRVRMLAAGNIDMVIDDRNAHLWTAQILNLADAFDIHPLKLSSEPIHLMFSKASVDRQVVEEVNRVIEQLQNSGELDLLLERLVKTLPQQAAQPNPS